MKALWRRMDIKASLHLCHAKGRFLFEVRPDVFPPCLTITEMELWSVYFKSLGTD